MGIPMQLDQGGIRHIRTVDWKGSTDICIPSSMDLISSFALSAGNATQNRSKCVITDKLGSYSYDPHLRGSGQSA